MPSQVFRRGPADATMNITPLIDVVFLLIIFFMLVSQLVAEQRVRMIVPRLEQPRAQALAPHDKIVVNIEPQPYLPVERRADPLEFTGQPQQVRVGAQVFDPGDVAGVTGAVRALAGEQPDAEVVLRADAALYFDTVEPIMTALASAGVGRVHLVAYRDEASPGAQPGAADTP